jgi:argininosuccinate lyase
MTKILTITKILTTTKILTIKRLLHILRRFLMKNTRQQTSMRSYVHVNTSIPMSNNNYMLYSINTNIYLMVLWEHGIMNPMILN